jgi:uncharacterized protein YkwD
MPISEKGQATSRKRPGVLKMVVRLGKPEGFAIGLAGLLAAILVCTASGPNLLQPIQAGPFPPPARVRQAPAPIQPWSQAPVSLKDVEDRIWRFTNDARRKYGLPPVSPEGALSRVSQAYSMDMLVRHFFSHTNPEGLTAGERLKSFYHGPIYGWGENIWEGSNLSTVDPEALARRIMDSWMSSSGHRQNILCPDYTHVGIGVAASGREILATQLFATLQRH